MIAADAGWELLGSFSNICPTLFRFFLPSYAPTYFSHNVRMKKRINTEAMLNFEIIYFHQQLCCPVNFLLSKLSMSTLMNNVNVSIFTEKKRNCKDCSFFFFFFFFLFCFVLSIGLIEIVFDNFDDKSVKVFISHSTFQKRYMSLFFHQSLFKPEFM